jgi:hypothetical protein
MTSDLVRDSTRGGDLVGISLFLAGFVVYRWESAGICGVNHRFPTDWLGSLPWGAQGEGGGNRLRCGAAGAMEFCAAAAGQGVVQGCHGQQRPIKAAAG